MKKIFFSIFAVFLILNLLFISVYILIISPRSFYRELSLIEVEFRSETNFEIKLPLVYDQFGITKTLLSLQTESIYPSDSVLRIFHSTEYLILKGRSQAFKLISQEKRDVQSFHSLEIFTNESSKEFKISYFIETVPNTEGNITYFFHASSNDCTILDEKNTELNLFGYFFVNGPINSSRNWSFSYPNIRIRDNSQHWAIACT